MPSLVKTIIVSFLYFFFVLLIVRFIFDLVMSFRRDYRPSGAFVVLLEVTYSVTDPPLKLIRRFLPPLRVGNFSLDLAFLIVFIVVQVLIRVVQTR